MLSNEAEWKNSFVIGTILARRVLAELLMRQAAFGCRLPPQLEVVTSPGLVDENCLYLGLPGDNVYVCDLSVFPTTPAANPSLTVVALAIRLANHLREKLSEPTE